MMGVGLAARALLDPAARGAGGDKPGEAAPRRARRPGGRLARHLLARVVLGLLLPACLLVAWEAAVRAGLIAGRLMPPPSRVWRTAAGLAGEGDLAHHMAATLERVGLGFALGATLGTLLGALSGVRAGARHLIDPTIQALRAIPSIAWVPLFILWLGIDEASKVTLIALGVFFPVYLGVLGAVAGVDRKLVEVGRMVRLSPLAMARRILLPAVLPAWVTALRTGLGLGFMFVVAAEIMGASEGLGTLLVDGQQLGRPDEILVALLAFALAGQLCDGALVLATRPLVAWQDVERRPF